jgi:hypothetical protein
LGKLTALIVGVIVDDGKGQVLIPSAAIEGVVVGKHLFLAAPLLPQ